MPDGLCSFFILGILARYETFFIRTKKFFETGKFPGLVIKHHGYLRRSCEIVQIASRYGLILEAQENYGFNEFRRSYILNKLVKKGSRLERQFRSLGRYFPYSRMFKFKKYA
jgi:hypothetical protein